MTKILNRFRCLPALALVAVMGMGLALAGCTDESVRQLVKDASVGTAKAVAGEVVTQAAAGDTKARRFVIESLGEYCDQVSTSTRGGLRTAFSVDGKAAIAVDCDVVRALANEPGSAAVPITEPPSNRRALALSRGAGALRAGRG